MAAKRVPPPPPVAAWTFLTNHAHVLICIAQNSDVRLRELATRVGITERAVHRIVSELEEAGYLKRHKEGRVVRYQIKKDLPLRHPIERHRRVSALLELWATS
jgi:DeoR/GlpR family transcriptional regulator of sugar metabolism